MARALIEAINQVIASFGEGIRRDDQIFAQSALDQVVMAGVAFSRSPEGGLYFRR